MTHYDEHDIELFLLGSEKILPRRPNIEQHLKECFSCREIAEELARFHDMLNGSQPQLKEHVEVEEFTSLELRPEHVRFRNAAPMTRVMHSIPSRFWHTATKRPVVATFTGLALVSLAILLFYGKPKTKDTEPAVIRLNESQESLEVYNQKYEKLWALPSSAAKTAKQEEERSSAQFSVIADLFGNGQHEVITTLTLPDEQKTGQSLKVLDGTMNLIGKRAPEKISVNYQGTHYETPYVYETLAIENLSGTGRKNIVVAANNGHSPWFLLRLDDSLNPIGRYWHFGGVFGLKMIDAHDGQKDQLVVWGMDQIGVMEKGRTRAFAAVLNPSKILGDKEATVTRGFGYPSSDAEVIYIRFPASDIHESLGLSPLVRLAVKEEKGYFRFLLSSENADAPPCFPIILSEDFHVKEVQPHSATISMHAKLKKEGKVNSTWDEEYLLNLGRGIQYWNGHSWSHEWTTVTRPSTQK